MRARPSDPMPLDFAPRRAAGSGDVDRGDPGIEESAHRVRADAPAHLFDDDGKIDGRTNASIFFEQPAKTRVAFGLQRLLQRVEVQHERVGAQQLDEPAAIVCAVTLVELHGAEIGEQQHLRRERADVERFERFRRLEQRLAPTPDPSPSRALAATVARMLLIRAPSGVPPVMHEISNGAARRRPKSRVDVSTSAKSISGSA